MSIQAVAWALDQDLPARPKLVLVSIANHASHTDGYCWLKAETIAGEASCSPRAVYNFIGDLIRNGYIRKAPRRGDDGKQRANDYWILFNREPAQWVGDRAAVEPEDAGEAAEDEPQDDVDRMHGVHAVSEPDQAPSEPVEKHAGAVGPYAPGCSHTDAEPSKTKPNENPTNSIRMDGVRAGVPRGYRPPPPQPIAAKTEGDPPDPMRFFVYEGTPAFDAWAKRKARESGLAKWHRTTTKVVDGKQRVGWYFPTLFPTGADSNATGPPATPSLTEDDLDALGKTGTI